MYLRAIGDDAASADAPALTLDALDQRAARIEALAAELIQRQKAEEERRRIATFATIAGAVFAAIKLGIVAIPTWRRRRAAALGQLSPASNPARRRRR